VNERAKNTESRIKTLTMQEVNYTLPDSISSKNDAEDILNRAPDVLADIEDNLFIANERLANAIARVRLENRESKDQIIRAMVQVDDGVKKEKVEVKKWKVLQVRWENANSNAKIFYKQFF